jgi:hypothetical protein
VARNAAGSSRRKFPRLNVRRVVTIGVDGQEFVLATVNLSFSGAFLETDRKLPVGTLLNFTLEIEGEPVTTAARVVHQNRDGVAVVFVSPPERFVNVLCQIISERITRDAELGAAKDEVPGRITLLVYEHGEYRLLFTSSLSSQGVWAVAEKTWPVAEKVWITLPEHGLFDSQASVVWSDGHVIRLEFIEPSEEFGRAYQRVLDAFLG